MIVIDTREPVEEILDILHGQKGTLRKYFKDIPNISFAALRYGDYFIDVGHSTMLVERKEVHDYCNSVGDDLQVRLFNMRNEASYTMLLIEGRPLNCTDSIILTNGLGLRQSIRYKSYVNFNFSQQRQGTFHLNTLNLEDTIKAIIVLHEYLEKNDENVKKPAKFGKELHRWFTALPYVSKTDANKLKDRYESCFDALKHIEDWASEKTLKRISQSWKGA